MKLKLKFEAEYAVAIAVASEIELAVAVCSFVAMNFTGASTYPSLSGVRKEMRAYVPFQLAAAVLGLAAWGTARFVGW